MVPRPAEPVLPQHNHVDDLGVSHVDPGVVTEYIGELAHLYGKVEPLGANRGEVHEYLGLSIDFRHKDEVWISMYDSLLELFKIPPDDMIGKKETAAPSDLFKTDYEDCEPLDGAKSSIVIME